MVVPFNIYLKDEEVNTFPKRISLKVNIIGRLEFESS